MKSTSESQVIIVSGQQHQRATAVQVDSTECHKGDSATLELTLRNASRGSTRYTASFSACYCERTNSVSLTSRLIYSQGGFFMDLPNKGQHIGTYVLSRIVKWVKQWPNATVAPIHLVAYNDTDNMRRRNRLWERAGLVFDYEQAEKHSGTSRAMIAEKLVEVDTWRQNIRESSPLEAVAELLEGKEQLSWDLARTKQELGATRRELNKTVGNPILRMLHRVF